MVKVVSKLQGTQQSGFEFRLVSVVTLMRCLIRGGETHLKAPCAASSHASLQRVGGASTGPTLAPNPPCDFCLACGRDLQYLNT